MSTSEAMATAQAAPVETLSADDLIDRALAAAMDAAALTIQTAIGAKTGDLAAQFFEGAEVDPAHEGAWTSMRAMLAAYLRAERAFGDQSAAA